MCTQIITKYLIGMHDRSRGTMQNFVIQFHDTSRERPWESLLNQSVCGLHSKTASLLNII